MPVKIRLMRIGATKRPFYRVVAVDERKKRTGAYLELLGTYNPITDPKEINLKQDRIDEWMKKGAVPSDGFLRIIGKAPQRPPRKPKKTKEETPATVAAPATEQAAETPEAAEESTPNAEAESPAEPTEVVEETPAESAPEVEAPTTEETPTTAEDEQPSE